MPASVTFCPAPVSSARFTRGGRPRRRVAGRGPGPGSGGGAPGTATAGRVLAAAAAGCGDAFGRYRAWPPGGTRTRARPRRLLRPFCEVTALLATVAPTATAGSRPVIGSLPSAALSRAGLPSAGRACRGTDPAILDPRRPGSGDVGGCPAGPGALRCRSAEKLSAPEQNSGAEGDRREDAHGDRSVNQSQVGREHPGHQHRHRRNGQEGTGADHVRPPTTRRGAPGCWLPAVVRRAVRGVEAPVVPSGLR